MNGKPLPTKGIQTNAKTKVFYFICSNQLLVQNITCCQYVSFRRRHRFHRSAIVRRLRARYRLLSTWSTYLGTAPFARLTWHLSYQLFAAITAVPSRRTCTIYLFNAFFLSFFVIRQISNVNSLVFEDYIFAYVIVLLWVLSVNYQSSFSVFSLILVKILFFYFTQ